MATVRESLKQFFGWCLVKLEALLWVLFASLILLYGNGEFDLVTAVLMHSDRSLKWLYLLAACFLVNIGLFLYMFVWLQSIQKIPNPEQGCPWAVPVASAAMVIGLWAAMVAIWPAFGLFSIFIVPILAMAALMSLHFVPEIGFLSTKVSKRD